MARESNEDMELEEDDLLKMVPFKAETSVETISIQYRKPDSEQSRIESMLPLPKWCHHDELLKQVILQEEMNSEEIFGSEEITVDLTAIFRKNRKRKEDNL